MDDKRFKAFPFKLVQSSFGLRARSKRAHLHAIEALTGARACWRHQENTVTPGFQEPDQRNRIRSGSRSDHLHRKVFFPSAFKGTLRANLCRRRDFAPGGGPRF